MLSLKYRNCNDAFPVTLMYLREKGIEMSSRAGDVLEYPEPVSIMYSHPTERVLFSPDRDINPFLHFFEPLWILAGRKDVLFLSTIVKRFSEYSDDGVTFNAAYGDRLRYPVDQIKEVIEKLRINPNDRQAVLQIRKPEDILYTGKDTACNLTIALKIRDDKLNLHVFNRSNDAIWGGPAGGANYPQFTVLQEYLAGHIGCKIGVYHQTTDSMHVYIDNPQWNVLKNSDIFVCDPYTQGKVHPYPMMRQPHKFDSDLYEFFINNERKNFTSDYFKEVVYPMWECFSDRKNGETGLKWAKAVAAEDWRIAVADWIERREEAKKRK